MSDQHDDNSPQDAEDRDGRAITDLVEAMLADGARTDDRVIGDAALRSEAEREFRIAAALRDDGPAPSLALLSSVERQVRAARDPAGERRERRAWGIRPAFLSVAAGIAAAVVLVAVLTIGSGGSTAGQSLNRAAALAYRPSVAPPPSAQSPTLLAVSYHGVSFPNYERRFGSNPTGERTDTIDGRSVLTIFYRLHDGTRLSYSVFAGAPVSVPAGAASTRFEGVSLRSYRTSSGLAVVTLVRHGRTCVLAAHGASVGALLDLAEWPLTVSNV